MKKFDRVTVLLGVGLILALLAGLSLVAGGFMKLFGFTYDSVGSLVLYFVAASVLSAVFGEVFSALPKVLYAMGKVNRGGRHPLSGPGHPGHRRGPRGGGPLDALGGGHRQGHRGSVAAVCPAGPWRF